MQRPASTVHVSHRIHAVMAALALSGCVAGGQAGPTQMADVAITNVTVIPMDGDRVEAATTVLIRDGRIDALVPAGRSVKATRTLDGTGKYVMPALADMHVHLAEPFGPRVGKRHESFPEDVSQQIYDEAFLYLANGVTLVRNMDGSPLILELRRRIRDGMVPGPEIVTAGPIVEGPGRGTYFKSRAEALRAWVESPEEATAVVNRQIDQGYDFIKVYNSMSRASYDAIIATARSRNVKVAGHVPWDVGIAHALAMRQDSIEHLRGYDIDPERLDADVRSPDRFTYWLKLDDPKLQAFASQTAQARIFNGPTMVVANGMDFSLSGKPLEQLPNYQYATPGLQSYYKQYTLFSADAVRATLKTLPRIQEFVRRLHASGAPLMAGTDTPVYLALPGFALHQELANYVALGLTPYQALELATVSPSTYLGRSASRGRVRQGYEADLLLLDANPLADIANTRRIAAVIDDGKVMDKASIDARLAAIAARNRVASGGQPN